MSVRTPHLARRARRQAGFNMLEVMITLVILTMTVVSVSSLTTITTRANEAARNRTHAVEFLRTWLERTKMDAMGWDGSTPAPDLFDGQPEGEWFSPADLIDSLPDKIRGTKAADFWNADVPTTSVSFANTRFPYFCAQLSWQALSAGTIRAGARVWWHREGGSSSLTSTFSQTNADGGVSTVTGPIETDRGRYLDCDIGADDITLDPRIYTVTGSTTLVALP